MSKIQSTWGQRKQRHSNGPRSLPRRHPAEKQLSSTLRRNQWSRSVRSHAFGWERVDLLHGNGSLSSRGFRRYWNRKSTAGIHLHLPERSWWWWNRHRYPGKPCPDRTVSLRWSRDVAVTLHEFLINTALSANRGSIRSTSNSILMSEDSFFTMSDRLMQTSSFAFNAEPDGCKQMGVVHVNDVLVIQI